VDIQPIVIGTAGHIDHGKSTLVKALTQIDPDRLKEEKERGLTIDLGFARLPLEDGRLVGIVDVPGHERFVRNMVAGATGIDLVVLVVAADDSVMPQTREHLAIMQLLGVSRGFVALTKVDLVDEEMAELAQEDVREFLQGTFLEGAPILPVSAITGQGMDELRAHLVAAAAETEPRSAAGVFRMPIQRVFTVRGFGTVVTGIPVSGQVEVGDVLEVVPGGLRGKVRGLQAYGEKAECARAGHSTAINVADLDHAAVHRGLVAAAPNFFAPVRMVGARMTALPSILRPITNRLPIRFHTGTADVPGEVVLLDADELLPGQVGLVQLRLSEPVVCAPGDPFVVRLLSPATTLGGGVVLEESRYRLKRFKGFVLDELAHQEESLNTPVALLESILARRGFEAFSAEELTTAVKRPASEVREYLDALVAEGRAVSPGNSGKYLHVDRLEAALAELRAAFDRWFTDFPMRRMVDVRELRSRTKFEPAFLQQLLTELESRGAVEQLPGGRVRDLSRGGDLDADARELAELLVVRLEQDPFQPPERAELPEALGRKKSEVDPVLEFLVDEERVVHVGADLYLAASAVARAHEALLACFERHGQLAIPELRDELKTTRKYLIPLLEYFDAQGVTIRQGGHRVLKKR
jgi:selenocysteine-specific elongation factor